VDEVSGEVYRPEQLSAVEQERERRSYELRGDGGIHIPVVKTPIELRLGHASSPCFIVPGRWCPQIGAEYIVMQPDVLAQSFSAGWMPIGGRHPDYFLIGQHESAFVVGVGRHEMPPYFEFAADVDGVHCQIATANSGGVVIRMLTDPGTGHAEVLLDHGAAAKHW